MKKIIKPNSQITHYAYTKEEIQENIEKALERMAKNRHNIEYTDEEKALRKKQQQMLSYPLCLGLSKIQGSRVQCCEHPLGHFLSYLGCHSTKREYVIVKFEEPKILYSFYVEKELVEIKYVRGKIVDGMVNLIEDYAVLRNGIDDVAKICSFIERNNKQILKCLSQKSRNIMDKTKKRLSPSTEN